MSSLTPRATALARKPATHCSKPGSARPADPDSAVATPANPESKFRRVRLGRGVVAITFMSRTDVRHWHEFVASIRELLSVRRLDLIRCAQFCHQRIKAAGEAFDIEVERVVVAIEDLR